MTGRPAAFLDRDGTIIRDAHYPADPDSVELLPGAADAIRRLREHGYAVVVVTNQSGIARGYYTTEQYDAVRARLEAVLAEAGAPVDATYMCPHHPDITGPCDCRKPGLLLYLRAIAEHGIDPARSVFIGDRRRDVAPAEALGGRGVLIRNEWTPAEDAAQADVVVGSLAEAVDVVLGRGP